jgi:hypothetical protein
MFQLTPESDLAKPAFVHEWQKLRRPKTSSPPIFVKKNKFYLLDKKCPPESDLF